MIVDINHIGIQGDSKNQAGGAIPVAAVGCRVPVEYSHFHPLLIDCFYSQCSTQTNNRIELKYSGITEKKELASRLVFGGFFVYS